MTDRERNIDTADAARRRNKRANEDLPQREGDVLGLSDADPAVAIPFKGARGTGHPEGIEVRDRATGIGDVPRRSGATGIDMGPAGEGTHITSRPSRPRNIEREEREGED